MKELNIDLVFEAMDDLVTQMINHTQDLQIFCTR